MVSGDKWSSEKGFEISDFDWFGNREFLLNKYLQENTRNLETFYQQEDRTTISKEIVDKYFKDLSECLPFVVKRYFRGIKFTYVLNAGRSPGYMYNIDINSGTVTEITGVKTLDFVNYLFKSIQRLLSS